MTEIDENELQIPITINSTLIKKEEVKKFGNRFIEDCIIINKMQTLMK